MIVFHDKTLKLCLFLASVRQCQMPGVTRVPNVARKKLDTTDVSQHKIEIR